MERHQQNIISGDLALYPPQKKLLNVQRRRSVNCSRRTAHLRTALLVGGHRDRLFYPHELGAEIP